MKAYQNESRGWATLAQVSAISLMLLGSLTMALIHNIRSLDSQTRAQTKQDYAQKERALLSALLHIVPNKAIGAMQRGSANNAENYTWEAIFEEAVLAANVEQSVDSTFLKGLGLSDAILANTGDSALDSVRDLVSAPVRTYSGSRGLVNGGNWYEYYMLFDSDIHDKIPAPLRLSYSDYVLDKTYPIISPEKLHVYNYNYHDPQYYKGLHVSTDAYPLYNLLRYPDVKFGYRKPGELFVAKRNWWIFSLEFGKSNEARSGIPAVKKDYVLSIYEVPSQLPLSSSALMKVGNFSDGVKWRNIDINGGLYADTLQTEGEVEIGQGSLSARNSIDLSDSTRIDGKTIEGDFDDLGKREKRALAADTDFYEASTGGNVGRVAFIPLNVGESFLERESDGSRNERISPTGWNDYTRGANQAAMRVEIHALHPGEAELPLAMRFHYKNTYGGTSQKTYITGIDWPLELLDPWDRFPFRLDLIQGLRPAFVLRLDKLPDFLESLPGAAGIEVNNSIYLHLDFVLPTVIPDISLLNTDLAITLREGEDMSEYSNGFSIVTSQTLFIADSLNKVPVTPPANSGLPSDAVYYPPVSLFAKDKRFGESLHGERPLMVGGQLSSLKTQSGDVFNPLDLKNAKGDRIEARKINADLVSLNSPAELPPIHLMNWMVTIEQLH